MTNADVIKMVAAKLSDDIIISAIASAPKKNFDLGADGLIALKRAGASDAVVAAMQGRAAPTAPAPVTAPAPQTRPAPATPAASTAVPQEPSAADGQIYRVDPATGALLPLEKFKDFKDQNSGSTRLFYIPGPSSSPVVFARGEAITFAIRVIARTNKKIDWAGYLDLQRLRSPKAVSFGMGSLSVDHNRRYLSKSGVNLEVESYPQAAGSADAQRPDRESLPLLLKFRGPLTPGEYYVSASAFLFRNDVQASADGDTHGAFRIE